MAIGLLHMVVGKYTDIFWWIFYGGIGGIGYIGGYFHGGILHGVI